MVAPVLQCGKSHSNTWPWASHPGGRPPFPYPGAGMQPSWLGAAGSHFGPRVRASVNQFLHVLCFNRRGSRSLVWVCELLV